MKPHSGRETSVSNILDPRLNCFWFMNYINIQARKSENENHPRLAFRDMAFAKWANKGHFTNKTEQNQLCQKWDKFKIFFRPYQYLLRLKKLTKIFFSKKFKILRFFEKNLKILSCNFFHWIQSCLFCFGNTILEFFWNRCKIANFLL